MATTTIGQTARDAAGTSPPRSKHAARVLGDLMALDPSVRSEFMAGMDAADIRAVLTAADREFGTMYGLWRDDLTGFCTDVLGESLWSKQRAILDAITRHRRIIVPAGAGLSKTYTAALAVVAWANVHPVGGSLTVSTATRMRQVERQLWPHVRKITARANLPGEVQVTQYKMRSDDGVDTVVAYGFTAPAHDEAGFQGIHSQRLLLIVDEAGGFDHVLGRATRNLLTGDARMLAIGNPATDDENTWFETVAERGADPDRPDSVTIRIPATSSPAITGEAMGPCRDCVPNLDGHTPAAHLNDATWIAETIEDYGEDDPYVVARVHALFPKGGASRAIPSDWVEAGAEAPDPEDAIRLCDLGLPEETSRAPVRLGSWVRLGVDVAADGGDELAIARLVGDVPEIVHTSSGATNEDPVAVAGIILTHIRRAEAVAAALGSTQPVRVKIDGIGVGWGVQGTLKAWGSEGMHHADIVSVNVSEKPDGPPDNASMVPANKRAALWLAGRAAIQPTRGPDGVTGPGSMRLGWLDRRTLAQLSAPKRMTNSGGLTVIEKKSDMKARGVKSPDRAEAVLLAAAEIVVPPRRRGALIV